MVTAVGIRTLHKVNFDGNNLLIVAVSLAAGLLSRDSADCSIQLSDLH